MGTGTGAIRFEKSVRSVIGDLKNGLYEQEQEQKHDYTSKLPNHAGLHTFTVYKEEAYSSTDNVGLASVRIMSAVGVSSDACKHGAFLDASDVTVHRTCADDLQPGIASDMGSTTHRCGGVLGAAVPPDNKSAAGCDGCGV
jgi:hypothetical protein